MSLLMTAGSTKVSYGFRIGSAAKAACYYFKVTDLPQLPRPKLLECYAICLAAMPFNQVKVNRHCIDLTSAT